MTFDPLAISVGLAGAWWGAGAYGVLVQEPALRAAGPEADGYLRALAARRGTGIFFAVLAFATVLSGIWTYIAHGLATSAWAGGHVWITLGVLTSVVALLLGATMNRVAENRWMTELQREVRGPGPAARAAKAAREELAARARRVNLLTVVVVGIAFIFLLAGALFP